MYILANINDFKIVKRKSIKMFEIVERELKKNFEFDETKKARLGFYHLILELILEITGSKEISKSIIDTEYNSCMFGEEINDLGIDAVYISENNDEHNNEIMLFNFKFRESFNPDRTQAETSLSRSQKFLEYIINESDLSEISAKVKDFIEKIREKLNSNDIWKLTLYNVSNEDKSFSKETDDFIKLLKNSYGMEIISINLNDVINYIYDKKENKKCKFIVSPNDFLSFNKNEQSTERSYVIKMNLIDIIRITCTNEDLSLKYNIENDDDVKTAVLDLSLLYDNVRGYLGETLYNKNIKRSLSEESSNFFMFNNGLTIISSKLESVEKNSGNKYLFSLENYQLVNGGQTIRSIYEYLKNDLDSCGISNLRKASVLTRIFKVSDDEENSNLKNRIAEYTNSQNSINPRDLKAVDTIQIQIEKFLEQCDIQYVRKAGSIGLKEKPYKHRIGIETLTKIIYSYMGNPEKVTNQKRKLFTDYYDEIYSNNFDVESILPKIEQYFNLLDTIENCTEQQAYYILYIMAQKNTDIEKANELLNEAISTYKSNSETSSARKLIQVAFKNHMDKLLSQ